MTLLIVTADDLGLHESINRAGVKAFRNGIVTACSVVANGAAFDHAAELLRAEPELDTGVHLTFVEEKPLLPCDQVRSLVGANNRFHKNFKTFAVRYATGQINLKELERELRAQIARVTAAGLKPRFLNSHQHLHALPQIFRMVERLASEMDIRYVRLPVDEVLDAPDMVRRVSIEVLNFLSRRSRESRTSRSALATIGVTAAGHLTSAKIGALLGSLKTDAELVVHPGDDDVALETAYDWKYEWEEELRALCSPEVRMSLTQYGVRTVGVREFLDLQPT